jgi:hypothetical protein
MRLLAAATIVALLTLPAHSEDDNLTPLQKIEKQQREDAKIIDKQYESTLKNTRSDAPKTNVDPWGNVRAADPLQANQKHQTK